MNQKADHVRRAPAGDGTHTCHWPGCQRIVKPARWGCKAHWFKLPAELRHEIWRAYRPGQEESKTPSREYVAAARRVQDWIMLHHPPAPSTDLFGAVPPGNPPTITRGTRPNGYAAPPGTGPAGKTCADCCHYVIKSMAKDYRKCGLMYAHWTGGPGSDIRARSPACRRFNEGDGGVIAGTNRTTGGWIGQP